MIAKLKRRLRVVHSEPISKHAEGYGFGGGRKITQLAHSPLANESNLIARAMSIRWHTGNHDAPSVEEAKAIIQRSERASRRQVTVPQPLSTHDESINVGSRRGNAIPLPGGGAS